MSGSNTEHIKSEAKNKAPRMGLSKKEDKNEFVIVKHGEYVFLGRLCLFYTISPNGPH